MAFSKRYYLIVDPSAPAFWDSASASAFICILSVGTLGAIATSVRLYGKVKLMKTLAWDDMFMLFAAISSIAYTVMALLRKRATDVPNIRFTSNKGIVEVRYGLVVPMQERPYELQEKYEVVNYSARVFYISGLTWFKESFQHPVIDRPTSY
ncbi:hypothetical protein TWF281_005497 [Arthrobotrys megalospora]